MQLRSTSTSSSGNGEMAKHRVLAAKRAALAFTVTP